MKGSFIYSILFTFLLSAVGLSLFGQSSKVNRLYKRGKVLNAREFAEDKINDLKDSNSAIKKRQYLNILLGKINYDLGDFSLAEAHYKKANELTESKLKDSVKLRLQDYNALDELALFYINTGNLSEGRQLSEKSLSNRLTKWNKGNALNYRPYLALGKYYLHFNELDTAEYYLLNYQRNIRNSNYNGFLDINRYANTFQELCDLSIIKDDWKGARKMGSKNIRLQKHTWTRKESGKNYFARITALNTQSVVFRHLAKHKKAEKLNSKALALYNKNFSTDHSVLIPIYINKSWLAFNENRIDSSKHYLKQSFELHANYIDNSFNYLSEYEKENVYPKMKRSFNDINALVFSFLNSNLIDPSDEFWTDYYDFTLKTKGLIVGQTNLILSRATKNDTTQALLTKRRVLKNQWARTASNSKKKNRTNNTDLLNEIASLEKQIATSILSEKESEFGTSGWRYIQKELNKNEVAVDLLRVELSTTEAKYLAFVFHNESKEPEIIIYENGHDLEGKYISNYFNSVKYNVQDSLSYNVFWKPLKKALSNFSKVYIAPDGVFHLINWDILKDSLGLIDATKIVNITNIKNIRNNKGQDYTFSSAVFFGGSIFSNYSEQELNKIGLSGEIPFLEGSKKEVQELHELLSETLNVSEKYLLEDASEKRLKEISSFDILHISTHGYFVNNNRSDPMFSAGLILSKSDTLDSGDGTLSAYEASTLNLENTKLVVLSACKTGLGKIEDGEGVFGLQRAFEVAGVNNILMSLWDVDDEVTKEFMVAFYKELINNYSCEDALRNVQLEFREKYTNPYYWGAFKLIKGL